MTDSGSQIRRLWAEYHLPSRTPQTSEFVAAIVQLSQECGTVSAELRSHTAILFSAGEQGGVTLVAPQAKDRLRIICARLAGWAVKNLGGHVNPYGRHIEGVASRGSGACRIMIDFMNTPREQWFRIVSSEAER